ncbi:MAG: hypothetical protein ACKO2A_02740, partial [Acidimicrobiaceae bacterium]
FHDAVLGQEKNTVEVRISWLARPTRTSSNQAPGWCTTIAVTTNGAATVWFLESSDDSLLTMHQDY